MKAEKIIAYIHQEGMLSFLLHALCALSLMAFAFFGLTWLVYRLFEYSDPAEDE